jgi:riboflavin kinase / FMN adenylyltransferase
MANLDSLTLAKPDQPTCVTIGAFDGVHRGHQQVLQELVTATRAGCRRTAALTFFPHPRQVLAPPIPHFYLTTPVERARLLHQYGMDLVITHPFNDEVRSIRATDFVDLLLAHLDVRELWVGPNFALGYQREGDVPFLQKQGKAKGFAVHVADFFSVDGQPVSSSSIRTAIRAGRIEEANSLLGRPFRLPGRVVAGDGRGRALGFPTANLTIWEEHAYPASGVYAAETTIDGLRWPAAVNIGVRPTVTAGDQLVIEAHLLDFAGDLYGTELALDFVGRIRNEIRFNGVDRLIAQLAQDVAETRRQVKACCVWR